MRRWGWILLALLLAGCGWNEALLTWQQEDGLWISRSQGQYYSLEATLPVVDEEIDASNKTRAEQRAQLFLKQYKARVKELESVGSEAADEAGAWVLTGEATAYQSLISVALVEYTFLPGSAHGSYDIETHTYANNQEIGLTDLFMPDVDVYQELSKLAYWGLLSSGQLGDYVDPQWVASGTEPTAANFSAFLVTPEGLELIFAPYQVGPWVLGEQRLVLPWDELMPLLNPAYFPA